MIQPNSQLQSTRPLNLRLCLACLEAVRELTKAITAYNFRISEFHVDVRKVEARVGYLCRVTRHDRETHGHRADI